jgi:hypothetical protein
MRTHVLPQAREGGVTGACSLVAPLRGEGRHAAIHPACTMHADALAVRWAGKCSRSTPNVSSTYYDTTPDTSEACDMGDRLHPSLLAAGMHEHVRRACTASMHLYVQGSMQGGSTRHKQATRIRCIYHAGCKSPCRETWSENWRRQPQQQNQRYSVSSSQG